VTPNDIIAALLDIASAAFAVQHMAPDNSTVGNGDIGKLRECFWRLNKLPQPTNLPPLTPSAKARYYMMEFIGGRPVEIDGKEFSAAFWLQALGEPVPPLQPGPALREFDWFDFLAYRAKMLDIWHDEGKSDAEIAATMCMSEVQVNLIRNRTRGLVPDRGPHKPVREMMVPPVDSETEECRFCGLSFETVCDTPPAGLCEKAIDKFYGDPTGGEVIPLAQPRSTAPRQDARELMNKALLELKDKYGVPVAKHIINKMGGVLRMSEIPDDKVSRVTIAARERMALEDRIAKLRAEGHQAGVESALREFHGQGEGKTAASPETAARQVEIQDKLHRVVTVTREAYGVQVPATIPTLGEAIFEREKFPDSGNPDTNTDDQVQGQGGEFDGGGASGDFQ
jgi:hypothetical protein